MSYNLTDILPTQPLSINPAEIITLHDYLTDRGIEHIFRRLYDGYQIVVGDEWDVICHGGSYGHERGLLEIMGKYVYNTIDSVEGYLTAEEIIRRIEAEDNEEKSDDDCYWENDWGDTFETEEEARNNVYDRMTDDDLIEELGYSIGYTELILWAMKQDQFFIDYADAIEEARDSFFRSNYHYVEEEELGE